MRHACDVRVRMSGGGYWSGSNIHMHTRMPRRDLLLLVGWSDMCCGYVRALPVQYIYSCMRAYVHLGRTSK